MTDLLSPREVAHLTGQSKSSVLRDIHAGLLPACKKRGYRGRKGRLFIRREDYREYLKHVFQPVS